MSKLQKKPSAFKREHPGLQLFSIFLGHFCQSCGSGMFIPDRDFYPSRIPDLGSRIQKQQLMRGVKKIFCHTCFCSQKFHKIENYFIFEMLKKKISKGQFSKNYELFTQKIVTLFSKIWVWDPRSGIRKKPIPDPGSSGQKGTGSRIPDPQH